MGKNNMPKYVYYFGGKQADGKGDMKNLLGGKGAGLAEMTNLGIPVPPGFTITTEVCTAFYENDRKWPEGLEEQIRENLKRLEEEMGAKFADPDNPLLLSVRSGARVSMPGMMDTVLNLGLNDATAQGLIKKTGNPRFVYDSYRRFVHMYSDVVLEVPHEAFEEAIAAKKKARGVKLDMDLTADDLKELVEEYKEIARKHTGKDFPEDPWEQLRGSINAVFDSWNNQRAITYRKINGIPGDWGTAVNVQTMVFGNMGETSGTGVAFTRDPATGENVFYGEYLMNAQGEDVVAGIRTPKPISELKKSMPEIYAQLEQIYHTLEKHYKDMQDIEFTIQDGRLFMLQTRNGKRTGTAAVRIAVEMVEEGLIDKKTAVLRVPPAQLDQLLHPMIDAKAKVDVIAKGLPASPGAAVGRVVFTAKAAEEWAARGEKVVLARTETSPEDIGGMHVAVGILTSRGGMTSHAAVVARGMGTCCVAGCGALIINEKEKRITCGDLTISEGDWITLNGSTGEVILGQVPLVEPELTGNFGKLMEWADEFRALKVRTNADTPEDAKQARYFGAEGIGLCRTEHMFFAEDRIRAMREMILADTEEQRRTALAKLLPYQKGDFMGIFREMDGLPVTIRLLDPPLHEFLPSLEQSKQIEELASEMGIAEQKVRDRIGALHELNPMLGFRGCRLGVVFSEIYEMQTRAIFEAACELVREGVNVMPEVMVPLVGTTGEMEMIREYVVGIADKTIKEYGVDLDYMVGTMIEVPRAALIADEIAKSAEFFSFGTNDMTQMVFGYSRDDAGKFLGEYMDRNVLKHDPFQSLDQEGVGQMVTMGVERGRSTRPDLKIGVCGEHGGDPDSVEFFHKAGLDYVSCSPYRVPIARLAAAQAEIKQPRK
ncbi:MAG TPA: pyruvate, phosphate dikinase [Bacillota bacterium]|nr:pyruvate, phosphate dikinase [Bacillota bacterium]HOO30720.1 pyruvate, phosphate dikinase [Bacillota bacterium]HPQ01707.1 pyruvate, phosphate dikinase [Bacillota bacterium]